VTRSILGKGTAYPDWWFLLFSSVSPRMFQDNCIIRWVLKACGSLRQFTYLPDCILINRLMFHASPPSAFRTVKIITSN
jgi:hypothetical protein